MGLKGSKPKAPKAPDYTALAQQQAQINAEAMNNQTIANRSNQYGPQGSVTWDIDPTTGQWSQQTSLSPENQFMYDLGKGGQLNAFGNFMQNAGNPLDTSWMQGWSAPNLSPLSTQGLQAWSTQGTSPISTAGLQNWGNAGTVQNNAGFGAVKEVQDAMMGLLQPSLDRQRAAEQQRLKAMGVTEMGEGWKSSMADLASSENDANNRAMMSAVSAQNDVFNRQLQAQQYADALRGKQLGERFDLSDQGMQQANFLNNLRTGQANEMLGFRDQAFQESGLLNEIRKGQFAEGLTQRNLPMSDFSSIANALNTFNPGFGSYYQAGMAPGADLVGAAQNQYNAAIDKYNAKAAGSGGGLLGTLGGIAGTALGSMAGPWGAAIGGALGGKLGGSLGGGGAAPMSGAPEIGGTGLSIPGAMTSNPYAMTPGYNPYALG